jgi:uncharacterized protein (UPF0332 family)
MKEGTRNLLGKAERAVQAARALLDSVGAEFAAGRAYYAMFYTAEALLHERDQRFSKHSGVHAAFGKEFAKTGLLDPKFHRWLLDAFDARLQDDYDAENLVSGERVEEMLSQAASFLAAAREFLTEKLPPAPSSDDASSQ